MVAKGADLVAQKIKEVAAENGVPIMENKPLAQALYREVEIGDTIPEKFYEAMSIILAEVYKPEQQVREPGRRRRPRGGGHMNGMGRMSPAEYRGRGNRHG